MLYGGYGPPTSDTAITSRRARARSLRSSLRPIVPADEVSLVRLPSLGLIVAAKAARITRGRRVSRGPRLHHTLSVGTLGNRERETS
jgi:hypothetical protein